jgi:CelD/BcsL family acetyltransferase involved in cellulose biosynthesis
MTIQVIDSPDALQKLRPEWSQLYRRCPRATAFQSPQWLLPWVTHLFQGGEIWSLAIRDRAELIGFAPLFCWGAPRRTVSFLGAGISDYGDLLFAPDREKECVAAVWSFLQERRGRWQTLDLQELRCGSGLLGGQQPEECSVCPVLDLNTYPGTMDHKHRTDVRRAQNKLRKYSELHFEMANETNLMRHLDAFFELHEARWGRVDDALRRFHKAAAAEFLATGDLRLCLLRLDNAPAAAVYAFTAGPSLYCYLSGFDPAMAKLSPGAVLLGWLIDRAVTEGLREVDFLRQTEAYKYLWGARDRVNYKLELSGSGAMACR